MDVAAEDATEKFVALTSKIVSAYVTNNKIQYAEIPSLIASIYSAVIRLNEEPAKEAERPALIVPIKRSITADYLISLEDGRRYKSLKRHLSGRGLTPAEYRDKWGLAKDYPMVAPNYAKQRSELAKALGLGQQRRKRPAAPMAEDAAPVPEGEAPRRKRGRPRLNPLPVTE